MSRIGKQPVAIPAGVKVNLDAGKIRVEGPKGKLEFVWHPNIKVESDGKAVNVTRPDDERQNRALHGLTRSLINNMVLGVTKGYEKRLKIEGIGYQAKLDKKSVVLMVGRGVWSADDMTDALEAKDRAALGFNAPPEGLYFVGASY